MNLADRVFKRDKVFLKITKLEKEFDGLSELILKWHFNKAGRVLWR